MHLKDTTYKLKHAQSLGVEFHLKRPFFIDLSVNM